MDANLAGFIALGALIVGLFAWLRMDIREVRAEMRQAISSLRGEIGTLREEIGSLRAELAELRERVARIEGLLEAVFMRRDLTPLPEPPPSGGPPGASEAA
ncbi:MAG: hypothetical protein J4F33_10015 [Alphaproteobacteria bacterium]|nr:hypothetical protein [Alphaproteobacteria bacterium]